MIAIIEPMKVYVIRHGQTNYNLDSLCNSDPSKDVHLTEKGIQQAESAANKLKDKELDVIYISNLKRTLQTAEIINVHHGLEFVEDARIGDRKTGFESKPASEFFAAVDASNDKVNAKFNDGESFAEERERVFGFLDELVSKNYRTVLLVTHAEIMTIIHGYFHNMDDIDMWNMEQFSNAEVIEIDT